MPFSVTNEMKTAASRIQKTPQVILIFDDIDYVFSTSEVSKIARYGDPNLTYGLAGLEYGGYVPVENNLALINMKGSTKNITQQLKQDESGASSTQAYKVNLVDKNDIISDIFKDYEMLGRNCDIYLSFQGLPFPENAIRIFAGVVSAITYPQGQVQLSILNPDFLKDTSIFPLRQSTLNGAITDSDTTIVVDSTENILADNDALSTYIQIEDEIIKVGAITPTSFTGCTRAQFGTIAVSHDDDTDFETRYRLQESPLILSLKLMMSSPDDFFASDIEIEAFKPAAYSSLGNAIFFKIFDVQDLYGLVQGDKITVTGSASNDFSLATILGFGQIDGLSYIVVDQTLTTEETTNGVAFLRSKYNVLDDGCKMTPRQVDVTQHEYIIDTFGSNFPDMDFFLTDSITAKSFIEKELYFVTGAYSLPRKGRASLGYTAPPLSPEGFTTLNVNNVVAPTKINVTRSTRSNFYNAMTWKYAQSKFSQKFLNVDIFQSADSLNRIPVGNRVLKIESLGLPNTGVAKQHIQQVSTRSLDRYKFAAVHLPNVQIKYEVGYRLEVGDIVLLDATGLNLYDFETGTKGDLTKLMEIVDKKMDLTTGKTTVSLLDTTYLNDVRYATMGPSSTLSNNGTTERLYLAKSLSNQLTNTDEVIKWENYVGNTVRVRTFDNTTFSEEVTLLSVEGSNILNISALSTPSQAGWIVDQPVYSGNVNNNRVWKLVHASINPTVQIVSGLSSTQFTVNAPDALRFFIDATCEILDATLTSSTIVKVTNIAGTTITVEDMGFTPDNTYKVERIGFASDEGQAYVLF